MVEPYSKHKTEKRCFAKMSSCFSSVVNSCLGKSILDCFLRQAGVFSFPLSLTKVRRYRWKCCVWRKVSRKLNWINLGSKAEWNSIIFWKSWVNILSSGIVVFSVYVEVGLKLPLFWSRGLSVLSLLHRWTSSLRLIHVFTQFLGPRLNPPPRPTPSASRQIIAADQRLPLWSWPACLWSAETRCKCSAVIALFHSAGLQHRRPPPSACLIYTQMFMRETHEWGSNEKCADRCWRPITGITFLLVFFYRTESPGLLLNKIITNIFIHPENLSISRTTLKSNLLQNRQKAHL